MRISDWSSDVCSSDLPADPLHYNRLVRLPFAASHERMWRDDGLYDLVVEIGHNDMTPVPGLGSAIFLPLDRPDWGPTEGCVALGRADPRAVVAAIGTDSDNASTQEWYRASAARPP